MNIAVFLIGTSGSGGGFQYELSVARILKQHENDSYRFTLLANTAKTVESFRACGLEVELFKESIPTKIHRILLRNLMVCRVLRKVRLHLTSLDRLLARNNVDLVYFVSPSGFAMDVKRTNYIFTVWDLCHRDFVEFPEVRFDEEFERREELYFKALPKAVAVIAESAHGKQNIMKRYGVDENRVLVLPFLHSESASAPENEYQEHYIDIRQKYGIHGNYIFYPAQFWAHKNHMYILKAMRILKKEYGKSIYAVFCGSDQGNLRYILKQASVYGLQDQVKYIGYVGNEEIPYLYRQALALVMPTYFGPTNIPPLEAFALGCPVCYSDLDGLREQVGEAGFLMDLNDPESLCRALNDIEEDRTTVARKTQMGRENAARWTSEDFWSSLKDILDKFNTVRECWG